MLNFSMPQRTVIQCGLAAVGSVLLLSWLRIRPLGIFFLVLFGFWFYKSRCNLRIVPPPELQRKLDSLTERIKDCRQAKPAMFCAVACGCLGALAILGHLISGSTVVLLGLILAAIISTKYNFKIVKIEHKDFAWSEKLNHDAELDDEFLPEWNETNLFVLERAGDLATLSSPIEEAEDEEKSDEIPSELLIPDLIPEIGDNSTDDDDDDGVNDANNLLPIITKKTTNDKEKSDKIIAKTLNSSLNKSLLDDGIEFKKGHFKRDSSLSTTSSSSEESLSKGLKFPDHTTVDGAPSNDGRQLIMGTSAVGAPYAAEALSSSSLSHNQDASDLVAAVVKTQAQALLENSGKLLPSLMSGLMQWGMGGGGGGDSDGVGAASGNDNAKTNNTSKTATATTSHANNPPIDFESSDESDYEFLEKDDFK